MSVNIINLVLQFVGLARKELNEKNELNEGDCKLSLKRSDLKEAAMDFVASPRILLFQVLSQLQFVTRFVHHTSDCCVIITVLCVFRILTSIFCICL